MTTVTLVFLACWLVIVSLPDTPIARCLSAWLVVAPAARLNAASRADAVIAIVIAAAVVAMTCLDDGDPLRMIVYAVPDAALWLTTIEVSAVVDAVVALVLVVRSGAWRIVANTAGAIVRRRPGHRRSIRSRPGRHPAANDDGERWPQRLAG